MKKEMNILKQYFVKKLVLKNKVHYREGSNVSLNIDFITLGPTQLIQCGVVKI